MAIGAGFLPIPLLGIPFVATAAFLFRPRVLSSTPAAVDYTLIVRIGLGQDPEPLLRELFEKHLEHSRLLATATARQGAALELTYAVRLRQENGAIALLAALNGIEGVQNVELRSA
jgi:hypothetical protein